MKKLLLLATLFAFFETRAQEIATLTVENNSNCTISRHIYGHFAEHLGRCIYDGFFRDGKIRMDVVAALKEIRVPNLRWPGGCFADRYNWRDGIGPKEKRPLRVNVDWGMVPEDNSFGTQEYLELCELLDCEPYIAGNMGTGSPKEMGEWLEYLNYGGKSELSNLRATNGHPQPYKVSFFGVGNESWGCGGHMTAEYYSNLYKEYANFLDRYPGAPPLRKIASGPMAEDYNWTETFFKNVSADQLWGISLHYYTIPTSNWGNKGSATNFNEAEYFNTMREALRMDPILSTHEGIMNRYDPQKRVALVVDEWGVWTNVEPQTNPSFLYQQNSFRDALVAASTLNIFNNHCERLRVANLAQSINVLQSVILTRGDQLLLTPTYHVFDLYKVHQDARFLPVALNGPDYIAGSQKIAAINVSASEDKNGSIHISLVNLDPHHGIKVLTSLARIADLKISGGQILTSEKVTDINTFDDPKHIIPKPFNDAKIVGAGQLEINLPATSIVVLTLTHNPIAEPKIIGKGVSTSDIQQLSELAERATSARDYAALATGVSAFLEKFGMAVDPAGINNLAWTIFTGSNNKPELEQALNWSKMVTQKTPGDANNLDTYANLLYKLGRKKEALEAEARALNLAAGADKPNFQSTIDKMKKGDPTW